MATIRDTYAPAASHAAELEIAKQIFATHREDGFDVTTLEIRTDRATGQTAIAVAYERESS